MIGFNFYYFNIYIFSFFVKNLEQYSYFYVVLGNIILLNTTNGNNFSFFFF